MTDRTYPAVVVPLSDEDGGGFAAYAPDLYGCMGDGDTQEAALLDLQAAILEWIDETVRLGRPIPEPGSCLAVQQADQKHLYDVIQKQERLLEAQDEMIAGLDKAMAGVQIELEAIKVEVKEALARLGQPEHDHSRGWRVSRALHFPVVLTLTEDATRRIGAGHDHAFLPIGPSGQPARKASAKVPH